MSRARQRCELVTSYRPSDIIAQKRKSAGSIALLILFKTYAMLTRAGDDLKVYDLPRKLCEHVREADDELVNLGPLHAWRPANADRYAIGIVQRLQDKESRDWDEIISHLKAVGWHLIILSNIVSGPDRTRAAMEITKTAAEVKAAMR